jgi:radical SAM protein with 4Fe4S-binding SPASM domain
MGTFSAGPRRDLGPLQADEHRGFQRTPTLVQWMVTGHCGGSCRHCMTAPGLGMRDLNAREAESLLDDVASMGVDELLITGGEPFDRPDLPALVDAIRDRGIRWSLNTARAPSTALLRAMRRWPPCFAAVSVDGPKEVHDEVRGWTGAYEESMRAIRVLSELTAGNVAAGTTVTRRTFRHLHETFGVVLSSGAASWGLHLVVPEGRARDKRGMALTPREVRGLIQFSAEKRAYFPVTLADELGYCGAWEPMVRDMPFFCGAGRTQCVVLPNGDVAACTTFDPRERAGNVRERPLSQIWATSFGHLRLGELDAVCRKCAHASVCAGGCWLQRRHGIHCHRDVWDRPSGLATAAGIAVCFGLAACSKPPASPDAGAGRATVEPVSSSVPPIASAPTVTAPTASVPAPRRGAGLGPLPPGMSVLDAAVIRWHRMQIAGGAVDERLIASVDGHLGSDPARPFVDAVLRGEPRPPLPARAAQIQAALETTQRSLHLTSLLWRDLALWCFDGTSAAQRSETDRRLLRETMLALGTKTRAWRQEIFNAKLDPFLRRDDPANRRWFLSKAGPPPEVRAAMLAAPKHWDSDKATTTITQAYLDAHPFASSMRLTLKVPHGSTLRLLKLDGATQLTGEGHVNIFDVVQVPSASQAITVNLLHGNATLPVQLPSGAELTHPDMLRLAYEQHRAQLDAEAANQSGWGPLLLPALRAKVVALAASGTTSSVLGSARRRLLYAWLF